MQFSFFIKNRDDFIDFARAIGRAVRDESEKPQTVIGFDVSRDSGKSLLPFGIDMAFHPEKYPGGEVPLHFFAENALCVSFNANTVVFENFEHSILSKTELFDKWVRTYKAQSPNAKVLCYSNIRRTISGEHDYAQKGMESEELDISIRVYKETGSTAGLSPNPFERRVIVDIPDNSPFAVSLATLACETRFAKVALKVRINKGKKKQTNPLKLGLAQMKNVALVTLMISALALSACRTSEGYRQKISGYIGASESDLIDAWGVPNDTYELENGIKVLQYNYVHQSYVDSPMVGTGFSHYGGRRGGSSLYHSAYIPMSPPPTVVTSACQTLFKLDRKTRRVIDTGFRGSACLADEIEAIQ